jgi:dihydroneopterin aldolase
MKIKSRLSIESLSVYCFLGCFEEEHRARQEVRVSLTVEFEQLPKACSSDRLEDTICYGTVCEKIQQIAKSQKFYTVEYLGNALFQNLEESFFKGNKWKLKVQKVSPPVHGLLNGVFFELEN